MIKLGNDHYCNPFVERSS